MNITTKHGKFERDCELYLVVAFHTFFCFRFISDLCCAGMLLPNVQASLGHWPIVLSIITGIDCPVVLWLHTLTSCYFHQNAVPHKNSLYRSVLFWQLRSLLIWPWAQVSSAYLALCPPCSMFVWVWLIGHSLTAHRSENRFRACIFDIAQETYRRNSYIINTCNLSSRCPMGKQSEKMTYVKWRTMFN